ncbi:glycosyltransferase family 9 protein [Sphingomonas sp.]|uniref:glycosyltransferase family 9 protein n=1 Tax=Sphingomonas sp. TaxID=28214 RepID=UPI003B3B6508
MSEIIIAPFSHNALRDWPAGQFKALTELLLRQISLHMSIAVVGTRSQRIAAAEIVRPFPVRRVSNACGLPWETVLHKLRGAACVIGNNSGITHVSSYFGVPTVCVFGGSHQRTEWGALGPTTVILSRVIGCSPCQLNHIRDCPYNAACLHEIEPGEVASAALRVMGRSDQHENAADRQKTGSLEKTVAQC